MRGLSVLFVMIVIGAARPAAAGAAFDTAGDYAAMPSAAKSYAKKIVKAIDADRAKGFLALLPAKLELNGIVHSKAEVKTSIELVGGRVRTAFSIWGTGDWHVLRCEQSFVLYRGDSLLKSTRLWLSRVKKKWQIQKIIEPAVIWDLDVSITDRPVTCEAAASVSVIPYARMGVIVSDGALAIDDVEPSVRRHALVVTYCFEHAAEADAALGGGVSDVLLTIDADGSVSKAHAEGFDQVDRCVERALEQATFGTSGSSTVALVRIEFQRFPG